MASSARKVAFVSGAGSGIGRATARMFAARGYAVCIADVAEQGGRETEAMVRDAGGEGFFAMMPRSRQHWARQSRAMAG
jgi:NAD(P)-dependent dehydrogenase (short-subunit alcohol dehydrogenase family)